MRSPIFVWATCFITLFLTALLVFYTTTQPFSFRLRLKFENPVINKHESTQIDQPEKFITYTPHSGLNNQRIELINALVLAKALNRTLIMPIVNIGHAIIWKPSPLGEETLSKCPNNHKKLRFCREFEKYVPVSTEFIFDLSGAHSSGIQTIQRTDMSMDYFKNTWAAEEDDIYRLQDTVRYSYRIYDSVDNTQNIRTFRYRVNMEELRAREERFIVFGSLHFTHRLAIDDAYLGSLREYLRREMGISHAIVTRQALTIISLLRGPDAFYGVHLRQADGFFAKSTQDTVETLKQTLRLPDLDQYRYNDDLPTEIPVTNPLSDAEESQVALLNDIDTSSSYMELLTTCATFQTKDVHPRLRLIYMATDTIQPRITLQSLYEEFPCIFTLSDFPDVIEQTMQMHPMLTGNAAIDQELTALGSSINGLLLPMIDAEITSHGRSFIGTKRSTFSQYINYRFLRLRSMYANPTK
ncbi:hypothetical protein BDB01DRAFT_792841 [Pilobolus umbonatus]|nr:hypothetical protein BDB01DRAFT_792841 [Pilobolus umbonatus]